MMKRITMCLQFTIIVAVSVLIFGCTKPSSAENRAAASPMAAANSANHGLQAQNPEEKVRRINAEEAKKLVLDNKAIIIDVRGTDAFKASHIKGSLDVPLNKLQTGDFTGIPKDKMIIAYCTCGHEQTSSRAAVLLEKAGYKEPAALLGGLHAWETAGGAVEKASLKQE